MWLGRLLIGVARPSARGRKRRSVGPSSTVIEEMTISSPTRSWLFSAFAAAESISLWMSSAAPRGENASSARAFSMCMPRTWSAIRRALRGATRTYLALARTTGTSSVWRRRRRLGAGFFASALSAFLARRRGFRSAFSSLPLSAFSALSALSALGALSAFADAFCLSGLDSFLAAFSPESFESAFSAGSFFSAFGFDSFLAAGFDSAFSAALASSAFASSLMSFSSAISQSVCLVPAAVRAEGTGGGELAELVADHRLRDEDRHVFFAVVDGDRVTDHLREDR